MYSEMIEINQRQLILGIQNICIYMYTWTFGVTGIKTKVWTLNSFNKIILANK